ncbi:DUF3631 domain-containing protein [Spirillospora sp. NPDC049652]
MTALAAVPSLAELNQPADGVALLDRVHAALTRYVVLPSPETAVAVTLWIAATHAVKAWQQAPRLAISSPEKRCGKSRLLDVVEALCHAPLMTVNASVAAIMRLVQDDAPPTLLFDEADTLWGTKRAAEGNEDLRGLLNAGWQRGRKIHRCEGDSNTPREFETFAMAALAGIGRLPDTITDRSVQVVMRRRGPGEHADAFRQRRDVPPLHALRDEVAAWLAAHLEELEHAVPVMPPGVEDRAADVWEPLLALADLAGGPWPDRARWACALLVAQAAADDAVSSTNLHLLADLREVLELVKSDFITSADLIQRLRALPESPWTTLTTKGLATRLQDYGIRPSGPQWVATDDGTRKTQKRGYRAADFTDAFTLYLPHPDTPPGSGPAQAGSPSPSQASHPSLSQVRPQTDTSAVTDASVTPKTAVTDPSVTAERPVTALTSESDACEGCDGTPRPGCGRCSPAPLGTCPRCRWGLDTQGHRAACGTDRTTDPTAITTRRN